MSKRISFIMFLVILLSAVCFGVINYPIKEMYRVSAAGNVNSLEVYFNIGCISDNDGLVLAIPVKYTREGQMLIGGLDIFRRTSFGYSAVNENMEKLAEYLNNKKLTYKESVTVFDGISAINSKQYDDVEEAKSYMKTELGWTEYQIKEIGIGYDSFYGDSISDYRCADLNDKYLGSFLTGRFFGSLIKPALSTANKIDLSALYFMSTNMGTIVINSEDASVSTGGYVPSHANYELQNPGTLTIKGKLSSTGIIKITNQSSERYVYVDSRVADRVKENPEISGSFVLSSNTTIFLCNYFYDTSYKRYISSYKLVLEDNIGNGKEINKESNGNTISNLKSFFVADLNEPSAEYYKFEGWSYLENGRQHMVEEIIYPLLTESELKNNELVLKAVYTAKKYSVEYKQTNSNITEADLKMPDNTIWQIGKDIKLPELKVDYYDFTGWYKDTSFKNKVETVTAGIIKEDSSGIKLYAGFTPIKYHVDIISNLNNIKLSKNQIEYSVETAKSLPVRNIIEGDSLHENMSASNLSKAYRFLGYYSGEDRITSAGGKDGMGIDTVEARFEPAVYKLTLDANGGKISKTEYDVTFNEITEIFPIPERSGYIFKGWFLGNEEIKGGEPSTFLKDTVLVARWEKIPEEKEKSDKSNDKASNDNTDKKAENGKESNSNSKDTNAEKSQKNNKDNSKRDKTKDKRETSTGDNDQIKKYKKIKVKKIKVLSKKDNLIKIDWKPCDGISKYQIQLSTSGSFKKKYTRNFYSSNNTCTIKKKFKKGKKYYIRVRTVKRIKGKNVYGKWSKVKKIQIKL